MIRFCPHCTGGVITVEGSLSYRCPDCGGTRRILECDECEQYMNDEEMYEFDEQQLCEKCYIKNEHEEL